MEILSKILPYSCGTDGLAQIEGSQFGISSVASKTLPYMPFGTGVLAVPPRTPLACTDLLCFGD